MYMRYSIYKVQTPDRNSEGNTFSNLLCAKLFNLQSNLTSLSLKNQKEHHKQQAGKPKRNPCKYISSSSFFTYPEKENENG